MLTDGNLLNYMDEDLLNAETVEVEFRTTIMEPIKDLSYMIGAATWTLEDALNLLATFKTKENEDQTVFLQNWLLCHKILVNTLKTYELEEPTFLTKGAVEYDGVTFSYFPPDCVVFPEKFIDWARELSLDVPDDFYDRLMRAQKKHAANRPLIGELSAKERRELARLRREQENFELAIKATVRAVQHCITAGRRVKRKEFFDLLTRGENAISKETLERILPLLPPEYRETVGAPSICKIGDPNEADG